LVDTTWALIAHERLGSADPSFALFSPRNPLQALPLTQRLSIYAAAGKNLNPKNPEATVPEIIKKIQEGRYLV
jgi:hypothetical protein